MVMEKEQIDHMVNRFLSWTLPADFTPDNGISYSQRAYAPTGTNLFTFTQARAMVLHMLTGLPEGDAEFEGELTGSDHARIDAAWETHNAAATMSAPDAQASVGEVAAVPIKAEFSCAPYSDGKRFALTVGYDISESETWNSHIQINGFEVTFDQKHAEEVIAAIRFCANAIRARLPAAAVAAVEGEGK